MKTCSIDFEFRGSGNEVLDLISVSLKHGEIVKSFWLLDEKERKQAKEYIKNITKTHTLLCFYGVAEGRALLSLGFTNKELLNMDVLDCYVLWLPIQRSNEGFGWWFNTDKNIWVESTVPDYLKGEKEHNFTYENEDGEITTIQNIKCKRSGKSLSAAVSNRLRINLDSKYKDEMRNLILNNKEFTTKEKSDIIKYCESDVEHLLKLGKHLLDDHLKITNFSINEIIEIFLWHSKWMFMNAIIEKNGLPFNRSRFEMLAYNYDNIKENLYKDMNKIYKLYEYDKGRYVKKYVLFEELIKKLNLQNSYPRSFKSNNFKRDKETLKSYESIKELKKYRDTEKALSNLRHFKNKHEILKNCGEDNRLRVMTNPYGSNTGRNQPSIKQGWVFGMSKWLRSLLDNEEDNVIIGVDYSSQEIAILASMAKDKNLMKAYKSGDAYTWFAKSCKALPNGIERKKGKFYLNGELYENQEYCKKQRNIFKTLMLGIGYGQGALAIGNQLTNVILSQISKEERDILDKALIDDKYKEQSEAIYNKYKISAKRKNKKYNSKEYMKLYYETFDKIRDYRNKTKNLFKKRKVVFSKDYWPSYYFMKENAIPNFPIQSTGSAILKKSVYYCLKEDLKVCATLHDAIYVESKEEKAEKELEILKSCMIKGARDVMGEDIIRVDGKVYKTDWDKGISDFTEGENEMLIKYKDFTKNNLF